MTTWVIKIGTSLLRGSHEYTTFDIINNYCSCISKAQRNGDKVILVSSGAVGLGCHKMSFKTRPNEIISLQASAAIGQLHLMALYEKAINEVGLLRQKLEERLFRLVLS
jgi:glutamate 5-kinase